MSESNLRINPPNMEANNQDVFVWALYILGGADKDVDVEEIYLKCFELAPARLGWRTQPQIPDYKKTSKALQSVEATTHIGLIHRPHQYSRRLTIDGIKWVETYRDILEKVYSGQVVAAPINTSVHERSRQNIKQSHLWAMFKSGETNLNISDIAALLRCNATSPQDTWKSRILDLRRASEVLNDKELEDFASIVEKCVIKEKK